MSEKMMAGQIGFHHIGRLITTITLSGDRVSGVISDVDTGAGKMMPRFTRKYGDRRKLGEMVNIKLVGGVGIHLPYSAEVLIGSRRA